MDIEAKERARKLGECERIDRVNDDIELIQRTDGLTFGTDALLLAGYMEASGGRALEIGGGTGIVSLLALTRGKFDTVDVCEVQESFADISARNAVINGLDLRMAVHAEDIRTFECERQFDAVFTNPPYMKATSGKGNVSGGKNIARHEVMGDITDFLRATRRLLRFGGRFYAVYRPDRLADLFAAMREETIEPKRMTLVHADVLSEPSMVLVEGRAGGGVGLKVTRPLILYKDGSHKCEGDDIAYIMKNGSFPEEFFIGNRGRKNG